jgi:hypothetical protein
MHPEDPIASSRLHAHFMVVLAFQRTLNLPQYSHSFAAFVKALDQNRLLNFGTEIHTISWMPATLDITVLTTEAEPGINLDLPATLELARRFESSIKTWGAYRIQQELYDRAVAQEARLMRGEIQYKVLDGDLRPHTASNCIHVISDLDTTDGLLNTGLARGNSASQMVVDHLRRWIVEPDRVHPWVGELLGLSGVRSSAIIQLAPGTGNVAEAGMV